MRTFTHWSPRYIISRIKDLLYRRFHPHHPWLTPQAIRFLDGWIKADYVAAEFGSGKSTAWIARRVSFLTSVEHDPNWYIKVTNSLKKANIINVNYILVNDHNQNEENCFDSRYLKIAQDLPENGLDFALVDGKFRSQCANILINKLRPGGLLIVDNANLYLPCDSKSPNSRINTIDPVSEEWCVFWNTIQNWKRIWTSNGVFDTAMFIKPKSSFD